MFRFFYKNEHPGMLNFTPKILCNSVSLRKIFTK